METRTRRSAGHPTLRRSVGDGHLDLRTEAGLRVAYQTHRLRLLAVARRVVVDPHLAEEAVQEAFTRAWRASDTFDPTSGPLLPWLVTITRNVAIDMVKARSRRPPVAGGFEQDAEPASVQQGHEAIVALRDELSGALRTLTAEHRQAVVETVVRGRPPAEVALELGIPPGTVRSRTHYALRHLRRVIEASRACAPCPA